ncbi:GtrA family protein [Dysgonomonas sp. OttesenSCG-928-M03]|nr:GtrA family protein [Dysgonomonas sp. OttesenSCG-928-M03]
MKQSYKEVLKYGLVGGIGIGVEWISFFILRDVFNINFIASHIIGSILAITNNFILNSYFTFKATDKIWQRAASFFGIAAIGLIISSSLLPIFVKVINYSLTYIDFISLSQKAVQNLAKLGATGIVVIMQFFLNKYFTFKKKQNDIQE